MASDDALVDRQQGRRRWFDGRSSTGGTATEDHEGGITPTEPATLGLNSRKESLLCVSGTSR